ncbi:MAG: heparinase II/III family protein [Gemmatimonadetes bacterium]|nr:heparinase II/III family protein [Gemmatimonadota bacterium]
MIILPDVPALAARRVAADGPLAPLAESLAADLAPWLAQPPHVDPRKARLTRQGGRCPGDQTVLTFDPASPHRHRCPRCGRFWTGEDHDGYWVYGYHLWLAERALHAALLHALRGEAAHRDFALRVLDEAATQYPRWPNRDNVLGPTRPFFSTYLESLWLLHLVLALDLLEGASAAPHALGQRVRDELVEPSARLIASYPEGRSNRQAWNASARAAAARLLGRPADVTDALTGADSVQALLADGLLADGSWYEGENYHQFAWRGLWHGVQLAESAGVALPAPLLARFALGPRVLVRAALPDLTLPSRRDSPHRTSLRQWRYAEMLELGLVRAPGDRAVRAALGRLYAADIPPGDTARARSTGEAERNEPPTRLTRADLGWKSLAFALPELPPPADDPPRSVLLPAQGLAIVRRDRATTYVALDFGETGGGHGHPDRLNLLLAHGATRWLDDVGTGSYTSRDLYWYRSSLAHNAPFIDGRTQRTGPGRLLAWDERGGAGWMSADVRDIAPGVEVMRTVVVMDGYLLDEVRWRAARPVTIDLPVHAEGTFSPALPWLPADLALPVDSDAGFDFCKFVEAAPWPLGLAPVFHAVRGTAKATVRFLLPEGSTLWRAEAPGPPTEGTRRFHAVRAHGREGTIVAVWDWTGGLVRDVERSGAHVTVHAAHDERHVHSREAYGWLVDLHAGNAHGSIELGGLTVAPPPGTPVIVAGAGTGDAASVAPPPDPPEATSAVGAQTAAPPLIRLVPGREWHATLAGPEWRWTEEDWATAGHPSAAVTLRAERGPSGATLHVALRVTKARPTFAPPRDDNPLDNEHPDINSDGLQLHLASTSLGEARWIVVPDGAGRARITPRTAAAARVPLSVRTDAEATGWSARIAVGLDAASARRFHLALLVNEIAAGRERRRGQLVLGGAHGQRAYLVGDRHDLHLAPIFSIADA